MGTRLPDTQMRWPAGGARPDAAWCRALAAALVEASAAEPKRLPRWLPSTVLSQLLVSCTGLLAAEETLVELHPPAGGDCRVTVVGDTHGQLHDVVHLLSPSVAGEPSSNHWVVFNGDLVDRGAWGVETLALACAWKLALPGQVTLLRGNHESEFCTSAYGFANELQAKFTVGKGRELYGRALRLFSVMPLAARLGKTLVLHGGLFRHPPVPQGKRKRASLVNGGAMSQSATESSLTQGAPEPCLPLSSLGTLAVLRDASRGGADPDGEGVNRVASDVLWSDPGPDNGLVFNEARGIGLMFGPDVTSAFCAANDLHLIIRSHEGPDARHKRERMGSMMSGWCVDHTPPCGARLATLFSAPDYPQFYAPTEERLGNTAAVAVLRGPPDWCDDITLLHYDAQPRPVAAPYYELDEPGSDVEGPTTHDEEVLALPIGGSVCWAPTSPAAAPTGVNGDAPHLDAGHVTTSEPEAPVASPDVGATPGVDAASAEEPAEPVEALAPPAFLPEEEEPRGSGHDELEAPRALAEVAQ